MDENIFRQESKSISFPYQDDIFSGESGHGYALRMCLKNGLPGLNYIKPLLGKSHSASLDACDAAFLANWFGGSAQHIAFGLEQIPHGKRSEGITYAGNEFGRSYFLNRSYPRICPFCIDEHGYCRLPWELSLCVACVKHGCLLLDVCPICNRGLSWGRHAIATCACGYPWNNRQTIADATLDELWLAQLLDENLFVRFDKTCLPPAPDWLRLIQGLSLDASMRVIFALATAEMYERPASPMIRMRSPLLNARKSIAAAAIIGGKIVHLEAIELRNNRPSVLVDLLCNLRFSKQTTDADLSTYQSLLSWLLPKASRSTSNSRYPSLAQQVLF